MLDIIFMGGLVLITVVGVSAGNLVCNMTWHQK